MAWRWLSFPSSLRGERVFRYVDTDGTSSQVAVGQSDPICETYCNLIAQGSIDNVIKNANEHEITSKLSVTEKLSIGSYMGVPIKLSTGRLYGTFCCFKSSADYSLNDRDLSFLNAFAEIVADLIEEQYEGEKRHEKMAERIQSALVSDVLDIHFQPIYSLLNNRLVGYECLSRFSTKPYRTPDIWFAEAAQVGMGEALEVFAIERAVSYLSELDNDVFISINVSPASVMSGAVTGALSKVDVKRIVLEITEHSPIENYASFKQAVEPLRQRGLLLAIDDAGAGYASFQHVLELEADIIKLDISLTRDIQNDHRKYLLAKALCSFARSVGCSVVAEGIENSEELQVLKTLGADKVQGYLLGRPMAIAEAKTFPQVITPETE